MSFATVADQFEFEGFPVFHAAETESAVRVYLRVSREKGGLVPQAMLPEALGLSTQRISQLVNSGRFECHKIAGKNFVTGDSLEAFLVEERKAGRGFKAPTFKTLIHAAATSMREGEAA